MRTLIGIAVAAAVGVVLAVTSAFALIAANAPDADAEQQIRKGATEQSVVEYGQR